MLMKNPNIRILVTMMKNCSSPSSSLVFMSCHAEPKQAPTLALVDHWIHFFFSFLSDVGQGVFVFNRVEVCTWLVKAVYLDFSQNCHMYLSKSLRVDI